MSVSFTALVMLTFKVEKWVGRNNIKFLLRPYFLTKKKEFSNFFLKVKKTTL